MNGAQAVVACLKEQGVDTVFGYPGGMILPLYDALYDSKEIKQVLVTHEQNAAHAADGYARASGKVGVCIATSGPGATNLVTGLATAFMDSIPVVAITGQVDTALLGRDAFQETDIVGVTMPVTKHNFKIKDPKQLVPAVREAFAIARAGRPGPVLIDVPRNVLLAEVNYTPEEPKKKTYRKPDADFLICAAEAEDVMLHAKRPVVIAGGGVISANASKEFQKFVEKYRFPVAETLMGIGALPYSHPQLLGFAGTSCFGSLILKLCFVTGMVTPTMCVSWCASRPKSAVSTCPVMATIGIESMNAVATPVTRFVAPGPDVAMQTPTFPLARA